LTKSQLPLESLLGPFWIAPWGNSPNELLMSKTT
jgi:hypothetical protein